MEEIINPALMPLINNGMLPSVRLTDLAYLREFINRVSSRDYLPGRDADALFERYGAMPDILSWGDYFQTELAFSLRGASDSEFRRAFATVRFDIISSWEIFSGKGRAFFDFIDNARDAVVTDGLESFEGVDRDEIIHLGILKDYYINLGILDRFTDSERKWYSSYGNAAAM